MIVRPDLNDIAVKTLRIPTLNERGSDSLDFHDVSVWSINAALTQAYEKGWADRSAVRPSWYNRLLPFMLLMVGMMIGWAIILIRMMWAGLAFMPVQ